MSTCCDQRGPTRRRAACGGAGRQRLASAGEPATRTGRRRTAKAVEELAHATPRVVQAADTSAVYGQQSASALRHPHARSACCDWRAMARRALCCTIATPSDASGTKGPIMNLEKFTDRAKGFLQSAQTVAIRMNHQRITPEHLLKALLEDEQGMAAGLIAARRRRAPRRRGARPTRRWPRSRRCRAAARSTTPGARQRRGARARPGRADRAEGGRQLRHRRAAAARAGAGARPPRPARRWQGAGVNAEALNAAINELRGGRTADTAGAEDRYDALKKFARDLTAGGARRQARSGDRPRRGDPPHRSRSSPAAPRTIRC